MCCLNLIFSAPLCTTQDIRTAIEAVGVADCLDIQLVRPSFAKLRSMTSTPAHCSAFLSFANVRSRSRRSQSRARKSRARTCRIRESISSNEEVEVPVKAAGLGSLEVPCGGRARDAKREDKSPTPKAKKGQGRRRRDRRTTSSNRSISEGTALRLVAGLMRKVRR